MVREKIINAEHPGDEFLRISENYWWVNSWNTDYAEKVYWGVNPYEDKERAQNYYDHIMQ